MDIGKLGVWYFTDRVTADTAAQWARTIESLGYSALWIPETTGRDPLAHAAWLLANTKRLIVATGIANIYHRQPGVALQAQKTLAEQSRNRFLLGLGVSHAPLVEGVRGLTYQKPLGMMRDYLASMDKAPYSSIEPMVAPPRVIAALGPKMLALARDMCAGAHPYFTSPAHTRMAREILGKNRLLCVEQKVILTADADIARERARTTASIYINLPNYRNNWKRMGLTEADLDSLSNHFIDTTFAWGDAKRIQERLQEHFDAGADHVCVQPVNPDGQFGNLDFKALEALAGFTPD